MASLEDIISGQVPNLAQMPRTEQAPNSGLYATAQATPPAMPQVAPRQNLKASLQSFTSDLMFTLAQSFAAGPQRGAGIAAAISGPMVRRSMLQEQADKDALRQQQMAKVQQDMAQTTQAMEKQKQEMKMLGIHEITLQDGSKKMIRINPPAYDGGKFGIEEIGQVAPPKPPTKDMRVIQDKVVDLNDPTKVIADYSKPEKPEKPKDMTLEETYADIMLQEAVAQNGGQPLSLPAQMKVREEARKKWTSLDNTPKAAGLSGELNSKQMQVAMQLTNSLKSHPAYVDMLDINTGMLGTESGLNQKNGLGDIAAINALQRMIDPGATVREGDVTLIRSASAILERVLSEYPIEKLRSGAVLPQATRDQLLKMAKDLYEVRGNNYNDLIGGQYKMLAAGAGIPFGYIGQDFATKANEAKAGGTITTPDGKQWQKVGDRMVQVGGK